MTTMMDIIMATFLGGVILLITLNANIVIRETWASYNSDFIVQQMLISNAQIVECEFRNMGCGLDTTQQTVTEARDTCIAFRLAPRPEPGTALMTIKYYTGSIAELSGTDNPADRFLYRQQDGGTPERVGLVTQFRLKYFTKEGTELATPIVTQLGDVRIVEVTMEVQSPFASFMTQDSTKLTPRFATALWKQTRLASQNLGR